MTVSGFVVVRLPELNYLVPGRDVVPKINGVYYSGVDRQRWVDIFDEDFYAKRTPQDVQRLAFALRSNARDFTGIDLCKDAEAASQLLQYSNRRGNSNELIVVCSPELEEIKGAVEVDSDVEWIGYDVVATGEWSLIAEGVFRNPEYFSAWLPRISRFGLFEEPSLLTEYVAAYEKAAKEGKSEPIAPKSAGLGTLFVEVGRLCKGA